MKLQLLPLVVATALVLWAGTESVSTTPPAQVPLCFKWKSPASWKSHRGNNFQSACLGSGIRLSYNATSIIGAEDGGEFEFYAEQVEVGYNDTAPTLNYWRNSSQHRNLTRVEYLFVQLEQHCRGKCYCLEVIFSECNHTASKNESAK